MAGNDLIGPKQSPNGDIVGMFVRGGDVYVPSGYGVVVQMGDGTYWRLRGDYVNGVDSSNGVNPVFEQLSLS